MVSRFSGDDFPNECVNGIAVGVLVRAVRYGDGDATADERQRYGGRLSGQGGGTSQKRG